VSVDVTWSATSSGPAISAPLNWGSISNGPGSAQTNDLYISHNGSEAITECAFYIQSYSGSYDGDADAATDYAELLTWGADDTNGFLINQDLLHSWVAGYTSHKTGRGTSAVPITLDSDSVVGGASLPDGQLDTGEEAHIKVKISVPTAVTTVGKRQFDQCLRYTYTS